MNRKIAKSTEIMIRIASSILPNQIPNFASHLSICSGTRNIRVFRSPGVRNLYRTDQHREIRGTHEKKIFGRISEGTGKETSSDDKTLRQSGGPVFEGELCL